MKRCSFRSIFATLFAVVVLVVQINAEEKTRPEYDIPTRLADTTALEHDLQFFLTGPAIEKCGATKGCCAESTAKACCAEASGVAQCSAACASSCSEQKSVASNDGRCCSSRKCNSNGSVFHEELHERLVESMTENAYLRARVEVQGELAAQQEKFLSQLIAAKVEAAQLAAHLEFVKHREQVANVHRIQNSYQQPQRFPQPVSPASSQLQAENSALKAQIAELKQRLQEFATRAAKQPSNPGNTLY